MSGACAYDFLALLHTRLDLGDVPLRFIVEVVFELGLAVDAQALLGVQLALADMAGGRGTC